MMILKDESSARIFVVFEERSCKYYVVFVVLFCSLKTPTKKISNPFDIIYYHLSLKTLRLRRHAGVIFWTRRRFLLLLLLARRKILLGLAVSKGFEEETSVAFIKV